MSTRTDLRTVEIFQDLGESEIQWLEERVRIVELAAGEAVIHEGDPADFLYGVLDGEIRGRKEKGLPDGLLYVIRRGQVSGMLPHSRMTHFPITARAVAASRLAILPSHLFPELIEAVPVLEARLASVMADRVKDTTEQIQLRERLIGLGKLSAGLAHELNNPAAAIRRSADELRGRVEGLGRLFETLLSELAGSDVMDELSVLRDLRDPAGGLVDALERSDAEDEISAWLEDQGVEEPWVAAETFVAAGIRRAHLAGLSGAPSAVRTVALRWLEEHIASRQLVGEIAHAAERISGIVTSVSSYSHMDRAPAEEAVDVVEGLESTLAVLAHKWRAKGVRVAREYPEERPSVVGNAGQLNQVWTNLLDNAIDASPTGGRITLRAHRSAGEVLVSILDEGAGIPDEIRGRVFEPFFTTKDVGRGTGLGLDIVKRIVDTHRGGIRVDSMPGRTEFEIRLPAAGDGMSGAS